MHLKSEQKVPFRARESSELLIWWTEMQIRNLRFFRPSIKVSRTNGNGGLDQSFPLATMGILPITICKWSQHLQLLCWLHFSGDFALIWHTESSLHQCCNQQSDWRHTVHRDLRVLRSVRWKTARDQWDWFSSVHKLFSSAMTKSCWVDCDDKGEFLLQPIWTRFVFVHVHRREKLPRRIAWSLRQLESSLQRFRLCRMNGRCSIHTEKLWVSRHRRADMHRNRIAFLAVVLCCSGKRPFLPKRCSSMCIWTIQRPFWSILRLLGCSQTLEPSDNVFRLWFSCYAVHLWYQRSRQKIRNLVQSLQTCLRMIRSEEKENEKISINEWEISTWRLTWIVSSGDCTIAISSIKFAIAGSSTAFVIASTSPAFVVVNSLVLFDVDNSFVLFVIGGAPPLDDDPVACDKSFILARKKSFQLKSVLSQKCEAGKYFKKKNCLFQCFEIKKSWLFELICYIPPMTY